MHRLVLLLGALLLASPALADTILLRPARVFDGVNPQPHEGWTVLVDGDRIAAAGPNVMAPTGARTIDLIRRIRLVIKGGQIVRDDAR